MNCGQEMSFSHESAKQQAGIGSGDNPALAEQVNRHRRNEASYRFRTGKEYQAVLRERLRLEKDRREVGHLCVNVCASACLFYAISNVFKTCFCS